LNSWKFSETDSWHVACRDAGRRYVMTPYGLRRRWMMDRTTAATEHLEEIVARERDQGKDGLSAFRGVLAGVVAGSVFWLGAIAAILNAR
jgi:hypothetical protein